ncbi:hypothetical protein AY600_17010 [Phormidium willei BDU 130791]|nr:hypothetical protein AY600_17010 [Phormidium willei BDU 130791]
MAGGQDGYTLVALTGGLGQLFRSWAISGLNGGERSGASLSAIKIPNFAQSYSKSGISAPILMIMTGAS